MGSSKEDIQTEEANWNGFSFSLPRFLRFLLFFFFSLSLLLGCVCVCTGREFAFFEIVLSNFFFCSCLRQGELYKYFDDVTVWLEVLLFGGFWTIFLQVFCFPAISICIVTFNILYLSSF